MANGPLPSPLRVTALHEALLAWYDGARRDLPWRKTHDPYAVWLSEVMLQQTRVDTVIPYYERFLALYPSVHVLAEAPIDAVLAEWSGLGYYRRARMLHAAAQHVATALGGSFPKTAEGLSQIKGIGPYTAGAVASIAFGVAAPLVDGNVARVLARLFAVEDDVRGSAGIARIWALAGRLVQGLGDRDPGAWNQALMELGATVCVPKGPRCLVCPVRAECEGRARGIENDLPRMKPKAKPRLEERWALVATFADDDAVLMGRRRADLRFGGMWEPPAFDRELGEDATRAARRFEEHLQIDLRAVQRAFEVVHVLSHRRLEIVVLHATLEGPCPRLPTDEYDRFERVAASELAPMACGRGAGDERANRRGLSTLARKLLAKR